MVIRLEATNGLNALIRYLYSRPSPASYRARGKSQVPLDRPGVKEFSVDWFWSSSQCFDRVSKCGFGAQVTGR